MLYQKIMNSKILKGILGEPKPQPGTFKARFSLEKRKELGQRLRLKHSDRVPVIVEIHPNRQDQLLSLDKTKFLVPPEMSAGKMLYEIRKHLEPTLTAEKALFMFTDQFSLAPISVTMDQMYQKYHNSEDQLLYLYICTENTFGNH